MYIPLFAEGIEYKTNIVRDDIEPVTIPAKIQVMVTLRYLGSASLQLSVADTLGMNQSSVSHCVHCVCPSLYLKMDDYIQWPNDINSTKNAFLALVGFPVVGAIDGTHIRIKEPKNNANTFIKWKYCPSINSSRKMGFLAHVALNDPTPGKRVHSLTPPSEQLKENL